MTQNNESQTQIAPPAHEPQLKGKVAIVTGAGSGLGRAIAVKYAEEGMRVVLCGRRRQKLQETADIIAQAGGEAVVRCVDVTDAVLVAALVERTLASYGQIDVLYNNAGVMSDIGPIWETDLERWWNALDVNLRGTLLCTNAVLPHMMERDSGIIINMSGGGAAGPMPGASGYGCSKAAVLRLTDTLAAELAKVDSSVDVYAMDPGFNPTEMTHTVASQPLADEWVPFVNKRLKEGEGHRPEECAQTSLELVLQAPASLRGRTIKVGDDIAALADDAAKPDSSDLRMLRLQ